MITKFEGINISSKNTLEFKRFYADLLGIPILSTDFSETGDYDGTSFGFMENAPCIILWDENKWGKCGDGVVLVFNCDDLDETYKELLKKGLNIMPPVTAVWGGKELWLSDPDGNKILLL